MRFSVIIPHYKTGKVTAFAIYQLLKHKGPHQLDIIVVDNSGDSSIEYIRPFVRALLEFNAADTLTMLNYPQGKMQSHGIAVDYAMPYVTNDYFIMVESDSYPTVEGWLDGYENLILNQQIDAAGSILTLSGGKYLHPAGALYKKSVYLEALEYTRTIPYIYFPNMGMKEGFPCHLMVREEIVQEFCENPAKWGIDLDHSYIDQTTKEKISPEKMMQKALEYQPVTKVFHNGMGHNQEAFSTYRLRDLKYADDVYLNSWMKLQDGILTEISPENVIYRMGYEPGQWFCYWMIANGKKVMGLPTQIEWMPGRVNQQQEFTRMNNGFTHLWGVTAYSDCVVEDFRDIIDHKRDVVEKNYESIPDQFKYTPR